VVSRFEHFLEEFTAPMDKIDAVSFLGGVAVTAETSIVQNLDVLPAFGVGAASAIVLSVLLRKLVHRTLDDS